jgi:cytochrome c-type biogenesis protein CcmE
MTRKGKRLTLIIGALAVLAGAAGLMLFALRDNIVFFYTPTDVVQKHPAAGSRMRVGGLVKAGSVARKEGGEIDFTVTDNANDLLVSYKGLLPDLFREGQGVVAEGVIEADGKFHPDPNGVLAKHDERYMPKDVADALKKQGVWQGQK